MFKDMSIDDDNDTNPYDQQIQKVNHGFID